MTIHIEIWVHSTYLSFRHVDSETNTTMKIWMKICG